MLIQILALLGIIVTAIGGYSYATTGTPLGAYSVFVTPFGSDSPKVHSVTTSPNTVIPSPPAQGNDPVGPSALDCSLDFPYNVSVEYILGQDIDKVTLDKKNNVVITYKDVAIYKALVADDDCQTEFRGRVDAKEPIEDKIGTDIKDQIGKGKLILDKSKIPPPRDPVIRSSFVLKR